ncbi:MAG TPA: hypothetical protein VKY59_12245 [Spirillospora sp.]|nr:hypothetical protein [Spirillospora sp.]
MPWRLHLTNRALLRLDLLDENNPPLLAAWTQPGRVSYLDVQSGAAMGEKRLADVGSRQPERWLLLQPELAAPNGVYPPVVPGPGITLYLSRTAQQRLYHLASGELYFVSPAQETHFSPGGVGAHRFLTAALKRTGDLAAALDSAGKLYLYRQHTQIGVFGLVPGIDPTAFTAVALPDADDTLYVAYDRCLLNVSAEGQVRKRLELHYPIGAFACSPRGHLLACSDKDTNVIRVYDGETLHPLRQRHALDLMAKATQVQLIADQPPSMVMLNTLTINDQGALAFGLAGVICVTDVSQMLALPQPAQPIHQEPI